MSDGLGRAESLICSQMGAPALYPGGLGVILMLILMSMVTPVEATAGTVIAILLGAANLSLLR